MTKKRLPLLSAARTATGIALLGLAGASCTAIADAAPEDPSAACFAEPVTHLEIINSCAEVVSYDKPALLPKFAPGAPLMPLP